MEHQNLPFDLNAAENLAKDYTNATGMECLVLCEDDQTLINPCPGKIHKELCFEKSPNIAKWCTINHHRGAINAKNKKDCSSYFCPMGLIHWVAPIVIDRKVCGAFVAGHAFLNKARDSILALNSRSQEHNKVLEENPTLAESILSSPVINDEKLDSLKRILMVMADSFSDSSLSSGQRIHIEELLKEYQKNTAAQTENQQWKALQEHLKIGNPALIENDLKEIIDELRNGNRELTDFKAKLTNVIVTIFQENKEQEGNSDLTEICINALDEMEPISDENQLANWAAKSIRSLLETAEYLPSIKNADMIYSALDYINQHYQEHISLQDIADHVHFSPPYFSKIFKKEMNMTFTQYLTKVRIEESKKHLQNPSIPLADIPSLVGFEEQSYFTKVFHSVVGTSPGKYREQMNY